MIRYVVIPLLSALWLLPALTLAQDHGEFVYREGVIEDDLYLAGGRVHVNAEAKGDVIAAGGRVLVERRVAGDVMAAGGSVEIRGQIADDVRAAGGQVQISATIGGDAVAAGGNVLLASQAQVAERAWLNGGEVEVAGKVGRELRINGGVVVISGEVGGDVYVMARTLKILSTAIIQGDLHYRGPEPAQVDAQATVAGEIHYEPTDHREMPAFSAGWALLFIFGMVLALWLPGAVLYLLFANGLLHAGRTIAERPGVCTGVGLAIVFATPPLSILLLMTGIGSVLGLTLLLSYALSMMAGFIVGSFYLSDAVLRRWQSAMQARKFWQLLYYLGTVVVLCVVALIPLLGQLALLSVLVLGIGALYYLIYQGVMVART